MEAVDSTSRASYSQQSLHPCFLVFPVGVNQLERELKPRLGTKTTIENGNHNWEMKQEWVTTIELLKVDAVDSTSRAS